MSYNFPTFTSSEPTILAPIPDPPAPVVFGKEDAVAPRYSWQGLLAGFIALVVAALLLRPTDESVPKGTNTIASVFFYPSTEAKGVICVLLALAAYTLTALFLQWQRLNADDALLANLKRVMLSAPPASLDEKLKNILENTGRRHLLVRATQSVWDARHLPSPDLEAISIALAGLDEAESGIGTTVGNRLMLLSLLGTVIGLARVIGTLGPQISAIGGTGDVQALLNNLQGTLTQMGTAFSSTAWGIVLATLVSWASGYCQSERGKYLAQVQYFAVSELAPRVIEGNVAVAMEQMKQMLSHGEQFLKASTATLEKAQKTQEKSLQRQDEQIEKILERSNELQRSEAEFVTAVEKTLDNAAGIVSDKIAAAGDFVVKGAKAQLSLAKQMDTLLKTSTQEMTSAASSLNQAASTVQTLSGVVGQVDTSMNSLVQALGKVEAEIGASVQQQMTYSTGVAAQQEKRLRDLSVDQEKQLRELSSKTVAQLNSILSDIQKIAAQSSSPEIARAIGSAVTPVSNDTKALVAAMNSLSQTVTAGLQALRQDIRQAGRQ